MLSFQTILPHTLELLKQIMAIPLFGSLRLVGGTALAYRIDGVKIDFVNYSRYPWIDDPVIEDGILLASPKDIAAMKVNAIIGRGSRKDFVDIYYLLQHFTLDEILSFYQQKYSNASLFRALLSLTYFNDAELQYMPEMLEDVGWDEMKQTILKAVKDYNNRNV